MSEPAARGSGTQSLSHFVEEVEFAAYDENGRPAIFVHRGGPALAASRCALGCIGIILRVDLRTVPRYRVREEVKVHAELDDVVAQYGDCPLTQFTLTPYRWDYLAFQRRPVERSAPSLRTKVFALLFRLYMRVVVDFAVHFGVWLAIRLGPWAVKGALKLAPSLLRFIRRTDYAEQVLTQKHDLPEGVKATLNGAFHEELLAARGTYTHHYPFLFRRVLPDGNTLVSMTASSEEPYFSIGVFTYYPPDRRDGYYSFCSWLARCLHAAANARLHWGKHFPLQAVDMARVYPELELFKGLCASADPRGVFTNPYTARVLGLPQRGRPERKAAA